MTIRKIRLDVDERTGAMSETALYCRSMGHRWMLRAASRSHTMKLLRDGVREFDRYCDNGCGATWRQVWDLRQRTIIENERRYPTQGAYLLPPGTGRLHRGDALVAQVAREFPELVH